MKKYFKFCLFIILLGSFSLFATSCKDTPESFDVIDNLDNFSLSVGNYDIVEIWNEKYKDNEGVVWTDYNKFIETAEYKENTLEGTFILERIQFYERFTIECPSKEIYETYKSQYTNEEGCTFDDTSFMIIYIKDKIWKETDQNKIEILTFGEYKNRIESSIYTNSTIVIEQTPSTSITKISITNNETDSIWVRTIQLTKK